jgi:hypothetical protein
MRDSLISSHIWSNDPCVHFPLLLNYGKVVPCNQVRASMVFSALEHEQKDDLLKSKVAVPTTLVLDESSYNHPQNKKYSIEHVEEKRTGKEQLRVTHRNQDKRDDEIQSSVRPN